MNTTNSDDNLTNFGFKRVTSAEKPGKVAEVFTSVASQYDLMNDLMSLGLHRIWKRMAVSLCQIRVGQTILDLAGGTGDLSYYFAQKTGKTGHVFLGDINESMLKRGRDRLIDDGITGNISYLQTDAEKLAFKDNSFNCICIAFGLRNVTHIEQALQSMYRVLKPGGRLVILEFSKLTSSKLQYIYDLYSFNVLPWLGKLIANDAESYQYLAESIRMHPDQETLKGMLESNDFSNCEYFNLCGGVVTIHRGYKF